MAYNILLVDDSASLRKVVRKVLHLSGFKMNQCFEAGNGQEALDVLKDNWVDLILSDIHMPVMDGFGLLKALRADEMWQDVPVVLVTTESNPERLQEALDLGAKGYIRKPFKPEEIRALLLRLLGESDDDSMAAEDEECDF